MVKKRGAPVWSAPLFLCPQIKNRGPLFQRSSILMVNAKTFRTMKKSSYLRIMVEAGGVEPPSENASSGTSPGADGHLHSLTPA